VVSCEYPKGIAVSIPIQGQGTVDLAWNLARQSKVCRVRLEGVFILGIIREECERRNGEERVGFGV
jgi:hypothetical protein